MRTLIRASITCGTSFQPVLAVLFLIAALPCWGSAADLQDHEGHRGIWLRTDSARVFVATEPVFRVISFSRSDDDEPSLMADRNEVEQGLRLAFMKPDQVKASFDVGNQPAEVLGRTEASAHVRLAAAAGLRYDVNVAMERDRPRLTLEYRLENIDDRRRRVACWSVIGFPTRGTIVAPFGAEPRSRRRLVLSWWTRWPQPNVRFGRDALAVDTTAAIDGSAMKIGLITSAGWAAFVQGQRGLVSTAVFDPAADYPEDGANVSLFQARDDQTGRTRCEIEQMGPLTDLAPGQAARLVERLDLIDLPEGSVELPPDELRDVIQSALSSR